MWQENGKAVRQLPKSCNNEKICALDVFSILLYSTILYLVRDLVYDVRFILCLIYADRYILPFASVVFASSDTVQI